jgi:two-component system heavy metal sensor histidine kinase CusS
MRPLSIRMRLTAGYLAVLTAATLLLAGGVWGLFRQSVIRAADASLAGRVYGTRRFIERIQRELPPEEVSDEFKEFGDMTRGEALLECIDEHGRTLHAPAMNGWEQLRVSPSPADALRVEAREVAGVPFRAVATEIVVDGHRFQLWAATSMADAYGSLNRLGWLLTALVPGVLVFAAAGGFWISGRALAPVDRITRDVKSISWRNLDRRLDEPPADDELRRLAVTFNDMLGRIQLAAAEMARFTADASHELRTPVALTRTTAEVALGRERSADEYRVALTEISTQMERMSALVNDLLLLARADAGVEPDATTTVDLGALVTETTDALHPTFAREGVRLDLDVAPASLTVNGNAESLRRLLVILLDNAIKYTPRDGHVTVRVSPAPQELPGRSGVAIDVIDSGTGLDAMDRVRAFDRFYRGAVARQQAPEGSGLGLSIARTIVDRHAGSISLAPGPGGRGCWARVVLPVHTLQPQELT